MRLISDLEIRISDLKVLPFGDEPKASHCTPASRRLWLLALEQHDCISRHRLLAADGAHVFPGLGFHIDRFECETQQFGHPLANRRLMAAQFRTLGKNRT